MTNTTHVWLKGLPKDLTKNDRKLNFKDNKVQYLTLNQLKSTVDERNTGQLPMNGMLHYALFEAIATILEKNNLKYELKPIAATEGGPGITPGVSVFPGFVEKHGEGSLESHLLRRLIGLFVIKDFAGKEYSPSLAVSFHQGGIQVAYGPNVNVCANMAIMGARMRMQTYGSDKIKVEKMLEVVSDWITNAQEYYEKQVKILDHFKQTLLTYRDVAELVGHMNFIRLARDTKEIDSRSEYPLNDTQVKTFTVDYLLKYQDLVQDIENPTVSLYDLYNMGTNLHKPENTDLPLIIGNNTALGNLFIDKFVPAELKF